MTTRIAVDRGACQGYANCMVSAGEVFELGEDGKVVVLPVDLDAVERRQLDEAVASCPAGALRLTDAS